MPIQAVLFDADGVLQHPRHGWHDRLVEWGGPQFPDAVFAAELPALRGERGFRQVLSEVVAQHRPAASVEDLLSLWRQVDVDESAWAVVADVRSRGVLTALATNQQDVRARFMRDELGYAGRVDHEFYSCDLGVAKPDPAFFRGVLRRLGIDAAATMFVDDSARNVETARTLGIRAVLHDPNAGSGRLREELREALT